MKQLFAIIAASVVMLVVPAEADMIRLNNPSPPCDGLNVPGSLPGPVQKVKPARRSVGHCDYNALINYHIERPMTHEYFPRLGCTLTFPEDSETADAIRRIARGRVTHWYHYCAKTMREAMGFGLGDAHDWMALPEYGYMPRDRKMGARAGDVLVWPFTYGRSNTQHIGIAVETPRGLRLLSNMNGRIQLDDIEPGYHAFWHNERMIADRHQAPPHRG